MSVYIINGILCNNSNLHIHSGYSYSNQRPVLHLITQISFGMFFLQPVETTDTSFCYLTFQNILCREHTPDYTRLHCTCHHRERGV